MDGIGIIDVKRYIDNENDVIVELRYYELEIESYYMLLHKSDRTGCVYLRFEYYDEALNHFRKIVSDHLEENTPLDDYALGYLELSNRAYNSLRRAGIDTISDLTQYTKRRLMRIRNLGVKSLNEIIQALREHGYVLEDE